MPYYDFLALLLHILEFRREFMVAFRMLHIIFCNFKAKKSSTH